MVYTIHKVVFRKFGDGGSYCFTKIKLDKTFLDVNVDMGYGMTGVSGIWVKLDVKLVRTWTSKGWMVSCY